MAVTTTITSPSDVPQAGRSHLATSFPGVGLSLYGSEALASSEEARLIHGVLVTIVSLLTCLESEEGWSHFHEGQGLTTRSLPVVTKLLSELDSVHQLS